MISFESLLIMQLTAATVYFIHMLALIKARQEAFIAQAKICKEKKLLLF